jgi:hypothetical protein
MSIQGLETPIDKNQFYTKGYKGYTTLTLSTPLAEFRYDGSASNDVQYIIPNVSVLDTTN